MQYEFPPSSVGHIKMTTKRASLLMATAIDSSSIRRDNHVGVLSKPPEWDINHLHISEIQISLETFTTQFRPMSVPRSLASLSRHFPPALAIAPFISSHRAILDDLPSCHVAEPGRGLILGRDRLCQAGKTLVLKHRHFRCNRGAASHCQYKPAFKRYW